MIASGNDHPPVEAVVVDDTPADRIGYLPGIGVNAVKHLVSIRNAVLVFVLARVHAIY
jgi:hypothetical protein